MMEKSKLRDFLIAIKIDIRSLIVMFLAALFVMSLATIIHRHLFTHNKSSIFSLWHSFSHEKLRSPATVNIELEVGSSISSNDQYAELNNIQNENKYLEKLLPNFTRAVGNWRGLEFSRLSAPEIYLLTHMGDLIGDQYKIDSYTQCGNLPCVFNKIYKNKNPLIGEYLYNFYLKTGYIISTSNYIPGQTSLRPGIYNQKSYELNEYLMDFDSIKMFVKLAHNLPENYLYHPLIRSIHVIPAGASLSENYLFADQCVKNTLTGQIFIKATCLNQNTISEFVAHISSYIDKYPSFDNITTPTSQSHEWLNLSLWKKEEGFDYKSKNYKFKWSSEYEDNYSSPAEFLNISMAKMAERKATKPHAPIQKFLTEKLFNGQNFNNEYIQNRAFELATIHWDTEEVYFWHTCLSQHKDKIDDLVKSNTRKIASNLTHPLFHCVESKIQTAKENVKNKIMPEIPFGLAFFTESHFSPLKEKFLNQFDKYIAEKMGSSKMEIIEYKQNAVKAQNVRYQFIKNYNPQSHYIVCHKNSFPEKCYDNMAKDEIYTLMRKIGPTSVNLSQKLINEVTLVAPFEQTKKNILIQSKKLFHPLKSQLDLASRKLWNECSKTPKTNGYFPQYHLDYQAHEYYMPSTMLYCLNKKMPQVIEKQLGLYKLKLDHKNIFQLNNDEKDYLYPVALNYFKQSLDMVLIKTATLELQNLYHYFFTEDKNLKNALNTINFSQMEILAIDDWNKTCLPLITKYYPKTQYYSVGDLHGNFGINVCKEFYLDNKHSFDKNISESWQKIEKNILNMYTAQLAIHAKTCGHRHPASFTPSNEDTTLAIESYDKRVCLHKAKEMAKDEVMDWWKTQRSYQFQNQYFLNIWNKLQ